MKMPNLFLLPRCVAALALAAAFPFSVDAGPVEKNPVVENLQRPFDWSGFYIGAHIGGAFSELEFTGSGGDTHGHLFTDVDVGQQLSPSFAGFDVVRFVDQFDK